MELIAPIQIHFITLVATKDETSLQDLPPACRGRDVELWADHWRFHGHLERRTSMNQQRYTNWRLTAGARGISWLMTSTWSDFIYLLFVNGKELREQTYFVSGSQSVCQLINCKFRKRKAYNSN
jgi:hypothetical protein